MNIFEIPYYIGYSIKKKYSLKIQKRLPYPVISIGNITVGGTGKTPLTIALAKEAKKRGFFPIVLTRGYKGRLKGPCFVERNEDARSLAYLYGDEPVLMLELLKDVPIIKSADRYKGGIFALKNLDTSKKPPLFILDDGFQHWKLYRDLDILLIDFTNPFGNYKLLPLGTLREPLCEIRRANIIIITKVETKDNLFNKVLKELITQIKTINPNAPIYFSNLKVNALIDKDGLQFSNELLRNKKIYAFCGIGNPESFKKHILSLQGNIVGFKIYRDHYNYTVKDLTSIIKNAAIKKCDYLITTQKDMVKLRGLKLPNNLLSLNVSFNIDNIFYDYVFEYIDKITTTREDKNNISTMDRTRKDMDRDSNKEAL